MNIEKIKQDINKWLLENEPSTFSLDPVINTLKTNHVGNFHFSSNLLILPYEIVEKKGPKVLQDKQEFLKYYDPELDPFFVDWKNHLERYWQDKMCLLDTYTQKPIKPLSPMECFNRMAELIKKIERRSILLVPEVKTVSQKQSRLSGEKKEYYVLRSYWIDNNGERKRLISRHIGDRHQDIDKEIAKMFLNRGYGVLVNYRSDAGYYYDMVIERDRLRSVVEIKSATPEVFDHLFLFDELLRRFEHQYPQK